MNVANLTVVPNSANHFDGKQIILGSFSGNSDNAKIVAALKTEFDNDFAEKWGPEVASAKEALNKAVNSLSKKHYNIQCLEQGNWVISLWEKTSENSVGIKYSPELRIWLDKNEQVNFSDPNDLKCQTIMDKFKAVHGSLTGTLLRKSVARFIKCEGDSVSLTPGYSTAGSVEFVPAAKYGDVDRYLKVIEENSDVKFGRYSMVCSDSDTVASITEGMVEEAAAEIAKVKEEMDKVADPKDKYTLSKKDTYYNRVEELYALQQKMERYAEILGASFQAVTADLNAVSASVMAASMMAEK